MSNTITFTPIDGGSMYTIDQLNALFTTLASVINQKYDLDVDPETVGSNMSFNQQEIINLLDNPADAFSAVTVITALQNLGLI